MTLLLRQLVNPSFDGADETRGVAVIAAELHRLLSSSEHGAAFVAANQPGVHSREAQNIVWTQARTLGFELEKKELFGNYKTRALRPDMYRPIDGSGIILEVERGKTIKNNMDLLDFWKCHICHHAHYLFLFVPQLLERSSETERPYEQVVRRLGAFFEPENLTNVRAAFVFGY
ncbi:MAG: hypothetical protein RLP09_33835 [Sandaracinaceae bacterium]